MADESKGEKEEVDIQWGEFQDLRRDMNFPTLITDLLRGRRPLSMVGGNAFVRKRIVTFCEAHDLPFVKFKCKQRRFVCVKHKKLTENRLRRYRCCTECDNYCPDRWRDGPDDECEREWHRPRLRGIAIVAPRPEDWTIEEWWAIISKEKQKGEVVSEVILVDDAASST